MGKARLVVSGHQGRHSIDFPSLDLQEGVDFRTSVRWRTGAIHGSAGTDYPELGIPVLVCCPSFSLNPD